MKRRLIYVKRSVIRSILEYAKACHPKEGILLLKGSIKRNRITVDEVEIPPLAVRGFGFSNFPLYMLPVDFSINNVFAMVFRPSFIFKANKFKFFGI